MKCANCGAENRPGLRFCEQCTRPLVAERPGPPAQAAVGDPGSSLICPRCGARNAPGLRFCERCATPLLVERPGPPAFVEMEKPSTAPRTRTRPARRVWRGLSWTAAALVTLSFLFLLSPVAGYMHHEAERRPALSRQETLQMTERFVAASYRHFAEMEPVVQDRTFGTDEGYELTYELPRIVQCPDGPVEFERKMIVRVNALSEQAVVAESQ